MATSIDGAAVDGGVVDTRFPCVNLLAVHVHLNRTACVGATGE